MVSNCHNRGIHNYVCYFLGQLYTVDVVKPSMFIFTTQLERKAVSFDTWYCQLVYIGLNTICIILFNDLVDELNIQGDLSISGLCKDCIFGKYATHSSHNMKI